MILLLSSLSFLFIIFYVGMTIIISSRPPPFPSPFIRPKAGPCGATMNGGNGTEAEGSEWRGESRKEWDSALTTSPVTSSALPSPVVRRSRPAGRIRREKSGGIRFITVSFTSPSHIRDRKGYEPYARWTAKRLEMDDDRSLHSRSSRFARRTFLSGSLCSPFTHYPLR